MAEDEPRLKAESEAQIRETQAQEVTRRMAEWEQGLKAEIFALRRAGEEQRLRIEAEIKQRNEAVARMEGQAADAEAEAHQTAEEIRHRAEKQARRRAEAPAAPPGEGI